MKGSSQKKCLKKMLCEMHQLKKQLSQFTPTYLRQSDFTKGTYMITQPGHYVVAEDIVFNPNSDSDYFPKPDQSEYQTLGFSLGFFAVIAIAARGVYLDLNGHTVSASPEFTLQQRFFSIIELADAPFLPKQGPGNFSTALTSAHDTVVANGTLGLSSHHGVHGNMVTNVLLEDLQIRDFEFVGIAINGGHSIAVNSVQIGPNRQDIPVLATYSGARFNRLFAKRLLERPEISQEMRRQLSSALNLLEEDMRITFNEVMSGQKVSSSLFENPSGLADGNVYGIVIKDPGVAINDFVVKSANKTKNVLLRKIRMCDLKCRVDEIIALTQKNGQGVCVDISGAVLPIDTIQSSGRYHGTSLSDLQLVMADISNQTGIKLGTLNIPREVVEWSKSEQDIKELTSQGFKYICGGDSMHHFNKLITFARLDALDNVCVVKCHFRDMANFGRMGNTSVNNPDTINFAAANRSGYFGADAAGVHLSLCTNSRIYKNNIEKIYSENGMAVGINAIHETDLSVDRVKIKDLKAGRLCSGKHWQGTDYWGEPAPYTGENPNKLPQAIGVRSENSQVDLNCVKIWDLRSVAPARKVVNI